MTMEYRHYVWDVRRKKANVTPELITEMVGDKGMDVKEMASQLGLTHKYLAEVIRGRPSFKLAYDRAIQGRN